MKLDISRFFQKKKKQILEQWMNAQLTDEGLREDLISNEELRNQSVELVELLSKTVTDQSLTDRESPVFSPVVDLLANISYSRALQGFSPRETGVYIFSLKDSILQTLQQEIGEDPAALYEYSLKISKLIDSFGISTFETFIKGREEVILRQTDEMTEISTPVIKVWDGILALPIIGTLDSSRTQIVMESLLEQIVATGSTIAILDISGVPSVDSLVAHHLMKTVSATRLLGAECIISGIRPEIAQTVVQLGIDFSHIITKATMASALKHAFSIIHLEVKKTVRITQSL
ncbi:STAS domain-containing protein [Cytophagaceae bacterium DM2B3-1]|uniref:STAS domain-containing protein n=1 Tax=Xanthocytophaga flava TaxID=3048013 RepID=A0ABT7CKE0_9BACT|nr:STAS domain-containing protein [Xanthocytophaga flavus]MDJ1493460.1 STAS domain-containing protein [Xanthocytophaga flavus]